jgi:hypothetical protein
MNVKQPASFAGSRLLPLLLATAALIAAAQLTSAPAHARSPVLLAACSFYDLEYQPSTWSPGCVGSSPILQNLSWQGWSGPVAAAAGQVSLNDCEPSCAEGTSHLYPAQMTASRVRRCRDGGRLHRQYTRVRLSWEYPADNPFGEPAGWHSFGLNPLRVDSSDCRREGEPLHKNRAQAQEISTAAVNLTLTRRDWDINAEGSVTRASGCHRVGKGRFLCQVFARASDLDGFHWWRGKMRVGIGQRKASWHWSGRRRKCTSIFSCGPAPFNWHGRISADDVAFWDA